MDGNSLIDELGLRPYFPEKLTLTDATTIRPTTSDRIITKIDIPWIILNKLIMIDHHGRDDPIAAYLQCHQEHSIKTEISPEEELFLDLQGGDILSDLNPQDVFIALFTCCDLILKQIIMSKMYICKLALPLVYPNIAQKKLVFSLWALRGIVVQWTHEKDALESVLPCHEFDIVSFIRIGRPCISKSQLLNSVLNDQQHPTFFHRDCKGGTSHRRLAEGVVEASMYWPGREQNKANKPTIILNLRGDATIHKRQTELLGSISSAILIVLDADNTENAVSVGAMENILTKGKKVLVTGNSKEKVTECIKKMDIVEANDVIIGFKGGKPKNAADLKKDICGALAQSCKIYPVSSLEEHCVQAAGCGVISDEEDPDCWTAKQTAISILQYMEGQSLMDCKRKMLPLQGQYWSKWSTLLKRRQDATKESSEKTFFEEKNELQERMDQCRHEQVRMCRQLHPMMQGFVKMLAGSYTITSLVLQWIKFYLDEKARKTLPKLKADYFMCWSNLTVAQEQNNDQMIANYKDHLQDLETDITDASLGLEHFFRELGQIYEACHSISDRDTIICTFNVDKLPHYAAMHLLHGLPFEIMDGAAANVPLTWVKAVTDSVQKQIGDSKLFTLCVVGIQSSGKSTLLNTMFGLQFAVSAGRCTKGLFMHLVHVSHGMYPFDYILVVDTEGLRAPELKEHKYRHDNKLATLVIGVGDVTILNMKGENTEEIKDILQIVVHAFLRMSMVNQKLDLKRKCMFIHQNVSAVDAQDKMMYGSKRLHELLDEITKEAAEEAGRPDIKSFKKVIDFDGSNDVWHVSDLWKGDPPVAAVNPSYSKRINEFKSFILKTSADAQQTYVSLKDISCRIGDIWDGILTDDFIFSFRNSLELKAYNALDREFLELTWPVERFALMEWMNGTADVLIKTCEDLNCLEQTMDRLKSDIHKKLHAQIASALEKLKLFFKKTNLRDYMVQWQQSKYTRLQQVKEDIICMVMAELRMRHEKKRVELVHQAKSAWYKQEITSKACALAEYIKDQGLTSEKIEKYFDKMWQDYVNGLQMITPQVGCSVAIESENVLHDYLHDKKPLLLHELKRIGFGMKPSIQVIENSIDTKDISTEYFRLKQKQSFPKSPSVQAGLGTFLAFFSKSKRIQDADQYYTTILANESTVILKQVGVLLYKLAQQDSRFQRHQMGQVIEIVQDGLKKCQDDRNLPFHIQPTFQVYLIVHAARYAVETFKEMNECYDKKHGMLAQLELYKHRTWRLFSNKVKSSTAEMTAADLFCDTPESVIIDAVTRKIPTAIVDETLKKYSLSKYHLLWDIQDSLINEDNIRNFIDFIRTPKDYAFTWMTKNIAEQYFGRDGQGKTKYANIAYVEAIKYVDNIRSAIKLAYAKQTTDTTMENWITFFLNEIKETLPVSVQSLKSMIHESVADFAHLDKQINKSLDRMLKKIEAYFHELTMETTKWEGSTPQECVLNKLWGCDAQCPFCKEPCINSVANHEPKAHSCLQHRPKGISGVKIHQTPTLVLDICTFDVASPDTTFSPCGVDNCDMCKQPYDSRLQYHLYRDYKESYPDWDIQPSRNIKCSPYWMWFVAKYQKDIENYYTGEIEEIPSSWKKITTKEARNSLRLVYLE